MITNVNPGRQAIPWSDFLMLCNSCDLVVHGPDVKDRYKVLHGNSEVMHQVSKVKSGNLRASGWFRYVSGINGSCNGHKLTTAGHVSVIETIIGNAPWISTIRPILHI